MKINSRSIVGLDTQVLIWAFCERDQPDIADLINCSKSIFKFLKKQEARIVISTVTVAEYLVGIDVREHVRTIKILEKHFTIAPFNTRAAMTCAPLFLPSKTLVNEDYTRKVLSADL